MNKNNDAKLLDIKYYMIDNIDDVKYAIEHCSKWLSKLKQYKALAKNETSLKYYIETIADVENEYSKLQLLLEKYEKGE